jgi:hypothetical protein
MSAGGHAGLEAQNTATRLGVPVAFAAPAARWASASATVAGSERQWLVEIETAEELVGHMFV